MKLKVYLVIGLMLISCSTNHNIKCNKSNFTVLYAVDKTISPENQKELNDYYIRIYQFRVNLDLENFNLCGLNRNKFVLRGEFKSQFNPQSAFVKIPKSDNDSLHVLIYNKGYVFPLNKKYNHYSLYLDENGNIENLDAHKDEVIFYE